MIRAIFILCLVFAASVTVKEIGGIGSSPMQPQKLTEALSFAVIVKGPKNALHWQITRDKTVSTEGADEITAGEATLPGEKYAYFWDREKKIFWFATVRVIMRMDLSNWAATRSDLVTTAGFDYIEGMPVAFRENVGKILNKDTSNPPKKAQ